MRSFSLGFAAPVPIGHRVELTIYRLHVRGLFARSAVDAVVRDRATGIVYAPVWVWKRTVVDDKLQFTDQLGKGVRQVQVVEGDVVSCTVVSDTGTHATMLTIDDVSDATEEPQL